MTTSITSIASANVSNQSSLNLSNPGNTNMKTQYTFNNITVEAPFVLGEQQEQAIVKLIAFLHNPNAHSFALEGFAGTGKTSCINVFAQYAEAIGYDVTYSAISHAAVAVLEENLDQYDHASTVHRVFGLKPSMDLENFNPSEIKFEYNKCAEDAVISGKVILVIDESSMLSDSLTDFVNSMISGGAKVIYMGDRKQAKPVKQNTVSKSLIGSDDSFLMTEVKRTNKADLLEFLLGLRAGKVVPKFSSDNYLITSDASVVTGAASTLAVRANEENNNKLLRVICGTNSSVSNWNKLVRRSLGFDNLFLSEGDILLSYSTVENSEVYNSFFYTVKSVTPNKKRYFHNGVAKQYTCYSVDILKKTRDDFEISTIDIVDSATVEKDYLSYIHSLMNKSGWGDYFGIAKKTCFFGDLKLGDKLLIGKTFDYGYAMTCHKSQGGTFSSVVIDLQSFEPFKRDPENYYNLLYVACSRAKEGFIAYSPKVKAEGFNSELQKNFDLWGFNPKKADENISNVNQNVSIDTIEDSNVNTLPNLPSNFISPMVVSDAPVGLYNQEELKEFFANLENCSTAEEADILIDLCKDRLEDRDVYKASGILAKISIAETEAKKTLESFDSALMAEVAELDKAFALPVDVLSVPPVKSFTIELPKVTEMSSVSKTTFAPISELVLAKDSKLSSSVPFGKYFGIDSSVVLMPTPTLKSSYSNKGYLTVTLGSKRVSYKYQVLLDNAKILDSSVVVTNSNYSLEEKVGFAMIVLECGIDTLIENGKKGYHSIVGTVELKNKEGKAYLSHCSLAKYIPSTGPLGEGSAGVFVNTRTPKLTPFMQYVSGDSYLSYEAPNKLVAREMKLASGKRNAIYAGNRTFYIYDTALNTDTPKWLQDMLVLGTSWVSKSEYSKLGSVRLVPHKSVTAPMPQSICELSEGEVFIGGNTHKSGLNGLLLECGYTHENVMTSEMTEEKAREILKPYIVTMTLKGQTFNAYKFDMSVSITNPYYIYGLEGLTSIEDDSLEVLDSSGFYNSIVGMIESSARNKEIFDLVSYTNKALDDGLIKRKNRIVEWTSAEFLQVAVDYGYETAKTVVDQFMTEGNVRSKSFLTSGVSKDRIFEGSVLKDIGAKTIHGNVQSTELPAEFALACVNTFGSDDAFAIVCGGYRFSFFPIGKFDIDSSTGFVKAGNSVLESLALLLTSLRNGKTDWKRKFKAHTLELNTKNWGKVQAWKTNGAYLPAVTGFWLKDNQVASFGDKAGKVTGAKLPILFNYSVTGLYNTFANSPYSVEELDSYSSQFARVAFVSPAFFLQQENDGDGDLVKISKYFDGIEMYSTQPLFTAKKVEEYVSGEYSSLKLKLKAVKAYSCDSFHAGNLAAKDAKQNVAKMSYNSYKVKHLMASTMESSDSFTAKTSYLLATLYSYLVQHEAMRAIKKEGKLSSYSIVKVGSGLGENPVDFDTFKVEIKKLLDSYFNIDYSNLSAKEEETFCSLISILHTYSFVDQDIEVISSVDKDFAFNLFQKTYGRNLSSLDINFSNYVASLTGEDKTKALALADSKLVSGGRSNIMFVNAAGRYVSKYGLEFADSNCYIFNYFLVKLVETAKSLPPKKEVVKTSSSTEVVSSVAAPVVTEDFSKVVSSVYVQSAKTELLTGDLVKGDNSYYLYISNNNGFVTALNSSGEAVVLNCSSLVKIRSNKVVIESGDRVVYTSKGFYNIDFALRTKYESAFGC